MTFHCDVSRKRKPSIEVADIFREYNHLLRKLPSHQAKVVRSIIDCRTEKLGGHACRCVDCGHKEQSYNSCRNRHCPKCQYLSKERWVQNRSRELLPVEYFHVVFTLPHNLKSLCLRNKKILYDILFRAASETLKEVGERRLQAEMGFVAVLHTWGQNLIDHPHLHFIVPGGGLNRNRTAWLSCKQGYLLPIKVLSEVFRGKFLSLLEKKFDQLNFLGKISDLRSRNIFKQLLKDSAKKPWVVYVKRPFKGPEQVIEYLGQYTHRVAISNHRLIKIENGKVHFQYRDYAHHNKNKVMVLTIKEFMRRFLLHVLPKKFVRLRHYGFLGNRLRKEKLAICKNILLPNNPEPTQTTKETDWKSILLKLTGIDLTRCPVCQGEMRDDSAVRTNSYSTDSS